MKSGRWRVDAGGWTTPVSVQFPPMATATVQPEAVQSETKPPKPKKEILPGRDYPWYSPRLWHGMSLSPWLKLAAENGFRFHPARVVMGLIVTNFAVGNSALKLMQQALFGRAIRETQIKEPPVFILGHWRSGTTYLHELLSHDERFATPTSYQCFQPHHMLLTEWITTNLFWWLMPSKRPQDNVKLGWNTPQEDEFALCAMGLPTPYRRMAFPNNGPVDLEYLHMQGLSDDKLQRWKEGLAWFVKLITYHTGRRVLLKSPPHTGRLGVLAEMFPGAKFIHLTRDPYSLFPSTIKLWRALHFAQGFQMSEGNDLEEYVFTCLEKMYEGFQADRPDVNDADIVDLRYEDLVTDPVGELRRTYEKLGLGGFDAVEPQLDAYAQASRSYQTNRYELDKDLREAITRRWHFYLESYGYET